MNLMLATSGSGALFDKCFNFELIKEQVKLIVLDRESSAIDICIKNDIKYQLIIEKDSIEFNTKMLEVAKLHNIDYVISYSFMRIFKKIFIDSYKGKIFNCHHSILPAFRGYYDARDKITQFHARDLFGRAVAYGSKIIGNTIHLIEDEYVDAGAPVIVSHLGVDPKIDPLQLRHQLFIQECQCFMQLITWLRNGRIKVSDSGVRVLDGNYQLSNFYPNLDEEFILKFTL